MTDSQTPNDPPLAAPTGSVAKPCPKCGKPMVEQPQFKGLWMCPDYRNALNDAPPFQYKCKGIELTEEGAEEFEQLLLKKWIEKNAAQN